MWAVSKLGLCFWLLQLSSLPALHLQLVSPHSAVEQLDAPLELMRNMQQLAFGFYQLVGTSSNVRGAARSKPKPKKPKYPLYHKLVIERFGLGNVSFNLGFTANFQVNAPFG